MARVPTPSSHPERVARVRARLEELRTRAGVPRDHSRIDESVLRVHAVLVEAASRDASEAAVLGRISWGSGPREREMHREGCPDAGRVSAGERYNRWLESGLQVGACLKEHEAGAWVLAALWQAVRGGMFGVVSECAGVSSVAACHDGGELEVQLRIVREWSRTNPDERLAVVAEAVWPWVEEAMHAAARAHPEEGCGDGERLVFGYVETGEMHHPLVGSYAHAALEERVVWARDGWVCYQVDEAGAAHLCELIAGYAIPPECTVLAPGAGLDVAEIAYRLHCSEGFHRFSEACRVAEDCLASV